jgi:large subunit ribosomal protein L6
MLMQEILVPSGVKVALSQEGTLISVSGKLGSTSKVINTGLSSVKIEGDKVIVKEAGNKRLAKKAELTVTAISSEITSAIKGVESGVEKKMKIIYAHFPMSIEIKGDLFMAKNVFGEKKPRIAKIVGTTKVEVKGQDVTVKGCDPYDVGQTAANIHRLSFVRKKDSRVFQDGIYFVAEE